MPERDAGGRPAEQVAVLRRPAKLVAVSWKPLPGESRRGDPVPLTAGLDRVLASLGAPPVDALTTIRDRWVDLVGPQAAEALVPVAVEHGRIVATADSGVWASQAKWLEPALVARAAELLGEGVVDGLVVRTREARS